MAERLKHGGCAAGTEEEAVTSEAPCAPPTQCHRLLKIRWRHSAGQKQGDFRRGRDLKNCAGKGGAETI